MARHRRERKHGPFMAASGYPQKHPSRQDHLWGWDDESIFYEPPPSVNLPNEEIAILIQEHPELMHQILNLCKQYAEKLAENGGGEKP